MATYSFETLESKYNNFIAPEANIIIDGQSVRQKEMAIGWVEVEQTTEAEADLARFSVMNSFEWNPTKTKWIGDTIQIGKTLKIEMGYADKKSVVFDGLITGYTADFPEDGSPVVTVTGMDRSLLLMKTAHSKVWNKMKASDVVRQIAADYSLGVDVDDTAIMKEHIEQIGVSDYHFIRSLAQDYDYRFYVTGTKLYFKKTETSGTPLLSLKYGYTLKQFVLGVDVSGQTSQVKVRGYDSVKKEAVESTASTVVAVGGSGKTGPSYAGLMSSQKKEIIYTQTASKDEAQKWADAMLARLSRELVKAQGSCVGIPELKPGELVEITGTGIGSGALKLLLTKATHRLDAQDGYITQFEAEGNAI